MASYSEIKREMAAAEKKAIKAALSETSTVDEAARKIGVSRRTMQNRMRALDIPKRKAGRRKKPLEYGRKGWTVEVTAVPKLPDEAQLKDAPADKIAVVNALREHSTVAASARALGVTRATLQKRMRSYGLPKGRSGRRKKYVGPKSEAAQPKQIIKKAELPVAPAPTLLGAIGSGIKELFTPSPISTEIASPEKSGALSEIATAVVLDLDKPKAAGAKKKAAATKKKPIEAAPAPATAAVEKPKRSKAERSSVAKEIAETPEQTARRLRKERARQAEAETAAMTGGIDPTLRAKREAEAAAEADRKAREMQELREKAARDEAKRQEIAERKAKEAAEKRARDIEEGQAAIRRVEEKQREEAEKKARAQESAKAAAAKLAEKRAAKKPAT